MEGPVSNFEAKWPKFMQQLRHPKLVAKDRGKTLERFYQVFFLGLMQSLDSLGEKGWEVSVEHRAGGSYVDIHLLLRRERKAVPIELKSSEKEGNMKRDANGALEQIVNKNYRTPEGLLNICTLREYGIAGCHLNSYVKGRYLELNTQRNICS